MDIEFTSLQKEDIPQIRLFLQQTIRDAFIQNGIGEREKEIQSEIAKKTDLLYQIKENTDKKTFFLIASVEQKIVGTIALIPPEEMIIKHLYIEPTNTIEISTVYVLPEFQNQNIGSRMFQKMLEMLEIKGIKRFCLDCGYEKSQSFWIKKLGLPDITLENYWGQGIDHMIWYRKTGDTIENKRFTV